MPNTWLLNLQCKKMRKYIFESKKVESIIHYRRKVFPRRTVDTEVIILGNDVPSDEHTVSVTVVEKDGVTDQYFVEQRRWQLRNGAPVTYSSGQLCRGWRTGLCHLPPSIVLPSSPRVPNRFRWARVSLAQTRRTVDEKPFVANSCLDHTFRPLLRGSLIQRYAILWEGNYWISLGDWLAEPRYSADYDAPKDRNPADRRSLGCHYGL